MTNRNPVKQLFITFPKSNIDKHTFRDALLRFEPEYYKVVEEKHKDGTPHLHAVIKFKNKYSKSFIIKYFKEKYPNDYKRIDVQIVRSIQKSLEYLSKEDTSPLETAGGYQESRGGSLVVTKQGSMKNIKEHMSSWFKEVGTPLLNPEEEKKFWETFEKKWDPQKE